MKSWQISNTYEMPLSRTRWLYSLKLSIITLITKKLSRIHHQNISFSTREKHIRTALLAVHFQSNLPQTVSSSTIELNRFLAKMASEQRNKNTITLKGSSQLVAEYLSKSSNLTVECISWPINTLNSLQKQHCVGILWG